MLLLPLYPSTSYLTPFYMTGTHVRRWEPTIERLDRPRPTCLPGKVFTTHLDVAPEKMTRPDLWGHTSTPTYSLTGKIHRTNQNGVVCCLYEQLSQSLSAQINPNLLVDGEDSPHEPRQSVSYTSLETSRRGIPSRSQPPADSCPHISACSITNSSLSGLGDKRVVNPVHQYQYRFGEADSF